MKSYVSVWVQSVAKTFSFSHAEVSAGADLGVMYTCVLAPAVAGLGLKKNIVCFRFPTDPIKTCATQIYFMDFLKKKKKKKKIFFFFFFSKSIS